MNAELEKVLAHRYALYDRHINPGTIFSDWGVECGPGWLELLIELAEKFNELDIDLLTIRVVEIKEKYWKLRIHIEVPAFQDTSDLSAFIDAIENRSSYLCEACGELKNAAIEHKCAIEKTTLEYHRQRFNYFLHNKCIIY